MNYSNKISLSTSSNSSSTSFSGSFESFPRSMEKSGLRGKLKRKGFWSSWKELYFILESNLLMEFKNETSMKPSKVFDISSYSIKLAENLTGSANSFALFSVNNKSKEPIFLLAATKSEMVEWVSALSKNVSSSELDWGTDQMLEAFNDGVVISSRKGIIIDVNDVLLKIFAYSRTDLIGKPVTVLMPMEYQSVHGNYMLAYERTGNKRLIGQPRLLPAMRSDGIRFDIILSLGELVEGESTEKRFIATIRLAQKEEEFKEETVKQVISETINEAVENMSEILKKSLENKLKPFYKAISDYNNRNSELRSQLKRLETAPRRENSPDRLMIDTHHIQVGEKLSKGIGGSGATVYSCCVDGWICAMKEFHIDYADPSMMEGIETEVSLLESLPFHRNLVRYLFHQRTNTTIRIFITRYSCNLSSILKKRKKEANFFSNTEVANFSLDIIRGLQQLHEHAIIHRDLKSDNIFVSLNANDDIDCLSIGDFDTSKLVTLQSQAKTTIGTPGYIAPEVLHSRNQTGYSFSADIWSFGMILYEIMTLKRPFEDSNVFDISSMTEKGYLPSISPEVEQLYPKMISFWKSCVSINPEERPNISQCKQILAQML